MRHNNLDVPSAIATAKRLRPIIDPIGMCVRRTRLLLCACAGVRA